MIAIVAHDLQGGIGKNGLLAWSLPDDLKHFKNVTLGHSVVMGRKTFESIGRPLPNRTNYVLTKDRNYKADGCILLHDYSDALALKGNVFVIGGGQIYRLMLYHCQELIVTTVHGNFDCDVFFPVIGNEWIQTSYELHNPDSRHEYGFTIKTLKRISHGKEERK